MKVQLGVHSHSLLNQMDNDFEYIVIDGASTDGTINIIQEYVPKFNGKNEIY